MNKHDIEELQSFLQDEYIEESTSRSLKEVKQHNKDVTRKKDSGDIMRIRKIVKPKLREDYGRYDGTREVWDKTPAIRDSNRTFLSMKKSECKNDDELYAFNYIDETLKGSDKTKVKNKMCKLVGLNPKVHGMDIFKHQPGEYFNINFIENSTKARQIFSNEINNYRYFHFSKTADLHNIGLNSSRSSRHGGGSIIYPSKCIFFYAIKKTADLNNVLSRMIFGDPRPRGNNASGYGQYVYEYVPKSSDKIFIDTTDDAALLSLQQKTRNHGFFKVFLNLGGEGRSSVPVKLFKTSITYNRSDTINQEEGLLRKYTSTLEDVYDYNAKKVDSVLDAFSKYIDDFNANPNSSKPKQELDRSLKKIADMYKRVLDIWINDRKIPQEERRLFKKNAYAHFQKRLKNQLSKRFRYSNNSYKLLTKYFHEYAFDETDGDYISESVESYIDETIERFDAFMEEFNNEQIGDSEFIMESAQDDKYAKITQDYIKKSGRSYFRYKKGEDTLPPEVEARIFDLAHKIIDFNDKGNFNQYKAYYDAFCKLVHHPNNTCIMGASINNIDDGYINLGILSNRKTAQRCPLKPGMHVYTTSNNPTLTTLDPYHFKGEPNSIRKTRSKNKMPGNDTYYAFPRAYFYVESFGSRYGGNTSKIQYDAKGIPIINNSDKGYGHLYMYTVKAGDQFYFDPELNDTGIIGRAVFMFVKKPVKLIKIY